MRKLVFAIILTMGITRFAYAGRAVDNYTFYTEYDPVSQSFVYSQAGAAATGDQVAVNTYTKKSIQITGVTVGEDIQISIQGRSKDQINCRSYLNTGVANWAILDTVDFGSASSDGAINQVVDVTEFVDFLRVGIKNNGASGASKIDVKGIFTNLGQ